MVTITVLQLKVVTLLGPRTRAPQATLSVCIERERERESQSVSDSSLIGGGAPSASVLFQLFDLFSELFTFSVLFFTP